MKKDSSGAGATLMKKRASEMEQQCHFYHGSIALVVTKALQNRGDMYHIGKKQFFVNVDYKEATQLPLVNCETASQLHMYPALHKA